MQTANILAHRAVAVMNTLPAELSKRLMKAPCARSLPASISHRASCLADTFSPAALPVVCRRSMPDMSGLELIQLVSEVRPADHFILIAESYDEAVDRIASSFSSHDVSCLSSRTVALVDDAGDFLAGACSRNSRIGKSTGFPRHCLFLHVSPSSSRTLMIKSTQELARLSERIDVDGLDHEHDRRRQEVGLMPTERSLPASRRNRSRETRGAAVRRAIGGSHRRRNKKVLR